MLKIRSSKKFFPLIFSLISIGILALIISGIKKTGYHITYSATASMPRGFYLIIPTKKIARHDIVEFIPPSNVRDLIKEQHWTPDSGLIIKYVFAIPKDHVCIKNQIVWVNGKKVSHVYKSYAKNKPLPQARICNKLKENQYLLLSTKSDRSFDSRYFGVVSSQEILGRAVPIFTYNTN